MKKGAKFSDCKKYRYSLWRIWDESKPLVAFIGLNPSTADETEDDPTIRRCINFAKDWCYGGIYMINIFAYRATDPKVMKRFLCPVGIHNDKHIIEICDKCKLIVAAWGSHGALFNRGRKVLNMLDKTVHCLGTTKNGLPKHPLYLKKDTELEIIKY